MKTCLPLRLTASRTTGILPVPEHGPEGRGTKYRGFAGA